jgi:hypothetical protein
MARRKHTTYRSEFASLSPLQQEHNLSLLRRLLAVFFLVLAFSVVCGETREMRHN